MKNKVSIVILNYQNWEDTVECLRSLSEISYPNTEIIVVDNDSRNDSLKHIGRYLSESKVAYVDVADSEIDGASRFPRNLILLQSSSNRGYAAGNNLGIRLALQRRADYVLILNNDTSVEEDFLEPLVKYAQQHESVGVVGPMVLNSEGRVDPSCARRRPTPGDYLFLVGIGKRLFPNSRWVRRHHYQGEYSFGHPKEVDILAGCCMLIKRSTLERVGLLDENTFLYFEELILHEKLRAAKLVSVVVPDSRIVHKGGKATTRMASAFIHNVVRSSLRYYLRCYRHYSRLSIALLMVASLGPKHLLASMRPGRHEFWGGLMCRKKRRP